MSEQMNTTHSHDNDPQIEEHELTEEQLETAAGGQTCIPFDPDPDPNPIPTDPFEPSGPFAPSSPYQV